MAHFRVMETLRGCFSDSSIDICSVRLTLGSRNEGIRGRVGDVDGVSSVNHEHALRKIDTR